MQTLKIKNVFEEKIEGKIRGKIYDGKGGKDRDFYISKSLGKELKTYLHKRKARNDPEDYLFYNSTLKNYRCTYSIKNMIKNVSKKVCPYKKITSHSFRRTFATKLHRKGV